MTFTKNTYASIASTGIRTIESLLFIPLLTKTLNLADYGIWSQLFATVVFLAPFLLLGTPPSFIRFATGKKQNKLFNTGLTTTLLSSVILVVLMSIFSHSLSYLILGTRNYYFLIIILAGIVATVAVRTVLQADLLAKQKFAQITTFDFIKSSLTIGFVVLALFFHTSIEWVLASYLLSQFISIFPYLGFLQTYKLQIKQKELQTIFSYGLPLAIIPVLQWVIQVSDQYILRGYTNLELVAYYSIAYSVASAIRLAATPLVTINESYAVKLFNEGKKKLSYKYIFSSQKISLLLLFSFSICILFLKNELITLFTTVEYANNITNPILGLLLFGMVAFILVLLNLSVLRLRKKTSTITRIFIISAIVNISLNFLLIPGLQVLGAAMATITTFLLAYLLSVIYTKQSVKEIKILGGIASVIGIPALILFILPIQPYVQTGIFLAYCFGITIHLIKHKATEQDKTIISKVVPKKCAELMEL